MGAIQCNKFAFTYNCYFNCFPIRAAYKKRVDLNLREDIFFLFGEFGPASTCLPAFPAKWNDGSTIEMKGITRCNLGLVRVGNFWKCYGSKASKS